MALLLCAGRPLPVGAADPLAVPGEIEALLIGPDAGRIAGAAPLSAEVADFYRARDFQPIWIADGRTSPAAAAAVAALGDAGRDGLRAEDYGVDALRRRLADREPSKLAEFELMLSDAIANYAGDLRAGRVSPKRIDPDLFVFERKVPVASVLSRVAEGNPSRVLGDLAPASAEYRRLRRALSEYREYARRGGWPALAYEGKLEQGMRGSAVDALRATMMATGDLPAGTPAGQPFDAALALAVESFQRRHGLAVDGIVGPKTRAQINVPVESRIRQIVINMERWRWLPDDLGDRYVLVNMAGFELEVVDAGQVVMSVRVIVGRTYRRTPVFSDRIRYLELNPTWTVPPKIAIADLLPKIRRNRDFLSDQGFRVFSDWSAGATELAPATIDWSKYGKGRFPFKMRQDPGAKNALGRIKFMFPNKYDVYLHDTPSQDLFRREVRTFSSGCIRVERPLELALYLLGEDSGWDRAKLDLHLARGMPERLKLPNPIPIYLTYSTAWIGEGGIVHFRDDIYERDAPLLAALYRK